MSFSTHKTSSVTSSQGSTMTMRPTLMYDFILASFVKIVTIDGQQLSITFWMRGH